MSNLKGAYVYVVIHMHTHMQTHGLVESGSFIYIQSISAWRCSINLLTRGYTQSL